MMDELPAWDEQSLLLPCVPLPLSHHNLQQCYIQSFNTFYVAAEESERWILTTDNRLLLGGA